MTGSLHWVTGGTRPDEAFATSQLQRKQSALLVSDHKRAVQTMKRLRGQPEIGLRFKPLPTKMCVLVYTDSALHNAGGIPIPTKKDQTMSGWRRQSRGVFGPAPSTGHTQAMLCEVVIGANVVPDEWAEEHMPIRAITDCKSLFDCWAKDASVPEDRGRH